MGLVIGLDPRPEGTEVVTVAAEAVGVLLTVAVRIVLRESAEHFVEFFDRGRSLEVQVVEPILADPEVLAGRFSNVARDSVNGAVSLGCIEEGLRVHLVVVVADNGVLIHVGGNVLQEACLHPLVVLGIHGPPPHDVRHVVGCHQQGDLGLAVSPIRENNEFELNVVLFLKFLLNAAVSCGEAGHNCNGNVHRFALVQNVDLVAGCSVAAAVGRSSAALGGSSAALGGSRRACGRIAVAAARCKYAYAQCKCQNNGCDFLHVHD